MLSWRTLQLGFKNLLLHKLRSALTALGVILGVASVIVMLAIGEGSKREALRQIRRLGAANVIIRSVKPNPQSLAGDSNRAGSRQAGFVQQYGLRYRDFDRLVGALPTVERGVSVVFVPVTAQREHRQIENARVLGTTPDYQLLKHLRVARGRFLAPADITGNSNVAVLSAGTARRLFSFQDPLGQTLFLGKHACRVVGVLHPVAAGGKVASSQNQLDSEIYVPLSAARRRFGELKTIRRGSAVFYERTELSEVTLTVRDTRHVLPTASMARRLLRDGHPSETDYQMIVPLELLRQTEQEKRIWNLVLGSIAGISLLVGGIGIMNIMLASITERTREIGIRRALGARRGDITAQFLVETVALSSTGGLLGALLGIATPMAVTRLFGIETFVSVWSVVLALGISVVVGIVFGMYPARRAAYMDPIEALRHE